jgi:very-short-patch-repair endonuclease
MAGGPGASDIDTPTVFCATRRSFVRWAHVAETDDHGSSVTSPSACANRSVVIFGCPEIANLHEKLETAESPKCRLWRIARAQRGVFTREQAADAGLSDGAIAWHVRTGAWVRVLPTVYRASSSAESWHQKLVAGCLWVGRGAAVSHRSAARLHRLEGVPPEGRHQPIELTAPIGIRLSATGFLVHRSGRIERADRTEIDGIPVTSLARTLIDISPTLTAARLATALDSALARDPGGGVFQKLRRSLDRLRSPGRAGTCALGRLLEERGPGAVHLDSALERRFAVALRRARLPRPVAHYVVVQNGRHIAEIDFAYPRKRLGIQLNGASVHRQYAVWQRDQEQLSDLAAAGWRIVHVTWAQLESNEAAVMKRVARALGRDEP